MIKGQVFLIHWNQVEAADYARQIGGWGWQVTLEAEDGAEAARAIHASPPDAIVIYLSRLPSHGRRTAAHLAEVKATRGIPVIFVGGEGDALEKTKQALPNATYIDEDQLADTLEQFSSSDG